MLTAVGDIMLDTSLRPPRVFYYSPPSTSSVANLRPMQPVPFLNTRDGREWLRALGTASDGVEATSHAAQSIALNLPDEASTPDYPFRQIKAAFAASDVVFANLECPLSSRGRPIRNDACYRASPAYATAMAAAGISVVSFSNNHCMDYGENAFLDTIRHVSESGIVVTGAVTGREQAPPLAVIRVGDLRIAFLAYNFVGPEIAYALDGECGILPLNLPTARRGIGRAKAEADMVAVSVHWGREGTARVPSQVVDLGHDLVDAGADVVLGHHSHVPGRIEIYKGKPIFYSLGNFVFGHTHSNWGDNILVHLAIENCRVRQFEVVPLSSRGVDQYQPSLAKGALGRRVLEAVIAASPGVPLRVMGDAGAVDL